MLNQMIDKHVLRAPYTTLVVSFVCLSICLSVYVTCSIHAETQPGRIIARSTNGHGLLYASAVAHLKTDLKVSLSLATIDARSAICLPTRRRCCRFPTSSIWRQHLPLPVTGMKTEPSSSRCRLSSIPDTVPQVWISVLDVRQSLPRMGNTVDDWARTVI